MVCFGSTLYEVLARWRKVLDSVLELCDTTLACVMLHTDAHFALVL